MTAYYNEFDPNAAAWLRELIRRGLIAPGDVDDRSILDVRPDDLEGYTQCHFFAGIGVWSYALRRAGWPDDRPVWTGSCPCQPFSAAGKSGGSNDERHLWPVWLDLIRELRPEVIFGEQVSSALAVGRSGVDLHSLWDRQATLRLLAHGMEEDVSHHLQEMQERDREGTSPLAVLQYRNAGKSAGGRRERPGSAEGAAVRPHGSVGAGTVGRGLLRSDGHSFQPSGETGLEHPLIRSEDTGSGVYDEKHTPHTVWAERGLWRLGRTEDGRHGVGDIGETARAIAEAVNRTWRSIEAANGWSWLNTLQFDLENENYASRAVDLCAAGVGAPHIRQRLWWVAERLADADHRSQHALLRSEQDDPIKDFRRRPANGLDGRLAGEHKSELGGLADANDAGLEGRREPGCERTAERLAGAGSVVGRLADAKGTGRREQRPYTERSRERSATEELEQRSGSSGVLADRRPGPTDGLWRAADWLFCRDGKWRPVEPWAEPVVDGIARSLGRVCDGRIRELEFEIAEWSQRYQIDPGEALYDLRRSLLQNAQREWPVGRLPDLHEAPFLLAFLRQLAGQGWAFAERLSGESPEIAETRMRMLRIAETAACTPRERGLDGQQPGERTDAMRILSSILAFHAQAAWRNSYDAHAAAGFPLKRNARASVMRIRGYGNAIVAPAAQVFIEAYLETEAGRHLQLTPETDIFS